AEIGHRSITLPAVLAVTAKRVHLSQVDAPIVCRFVSMRARPRRRKACTCHGRAERGRRRRGADKSATYTPVPEGRPRDYAPRGRAPSGTHRRTLGGTARGDRGTGNHCPGVWLCLGVDCTT